MTINDMHNIAINMALKELEKLEKLAHELAEEKNIEDLMKIIDVLLDLNRQQLEKQRPKEVGTND